MATKIFYAIITFPFRCIRLVYRGVKQVAAKAINKVVKFGVEAQWKGEGILLAVITVLLMFAMLGFVATVAAISEMVRDA